MYNKVHIKCDYYPTEQKSHEVSVWYFVNWIESWLTFSERYWWRREMIWSQWLEWQNLQNPAKFEASWQKASPQNSRGTFCSTLLQSLVLFITVIVYLYSPNSLQYCTLENCKENIHRYKCRSAFTILWIILIITYKTDLKYIWK